MSGNDKAAAPLEETLDGREPGALLIEACALNSDANADAKADDAEPRVVHVGEPAADSEPVVDEEKVVAEMALTVPETDPERVAYAMWNEGRADEAIALLEQHLTAERSRRRETALVLASDDGKDAIRVEPTSEWRERHRAALASGDFNAFGASTHTIDITPTQADAVVPHTARGSLRVGWLMGVCLAVLCVSAAGSYFVARDGGMTTLLSATEEVVADLNPAATAPAMNDEEAAETNLAVIEPDADSADVPPNEIELVDIPPAAEDAVVVPPEAETPADNAAVSSPPEENAALDDVASAAPEEVAAPVEVAVASIPPTENTPRDDVGSAPPVDASLLPAPSDTAVENTAATDAPVSADDAPAVTASVEAILETLAPPPIVEARLPRSRPEPSASVIERASRSEVVVSEEPPIPDSDLPLVVSEPPQTEAEVASIESDVPVYGPDGPVRVYRHIRRAPYPPVLGRAAFPRRTLTPAEYRALVERRAWAERYTAERRSGVIGRILTLP
jgi:hypothetical protein